MPKTNHISVTKFNFKPLQAQDIPLLIKWLNKIHVKSWWDDHLTDEQIKEKYSQLIGDKIVNAFIVYFDEHAIGYIQYYWAAQVGGGWWPNASADTVGIDQFIGEEDYIGHGYGTTMIKAFINNLFKNPAINKIITDVNPNNLRAMRCYEKVGFKQLGLMHTPDGLMLIMEFYTLLLT